MKIGAPFNYKLKRGLAGRRQSCTRVKSAFSKDDKVIWMHAASLGEYLQGLPVLTRLKEELPNHKILITFFSPSGYENVIKKETIADVICYLPFDREKWIDEFTSHFKTDIFFTVKYDYWYNLLAHLKKSGAKMYVISAYFHETQVFFKPYGNWFVSSLKNSIDWFFHQTKHSTALAKSVGLTNSSTSGDTRFDQVKHNLIRNNEVSGLFRFVNGKKVVVFGSSWQAEERIAEIVSKKTPNVKIIIAPHDLKRVESLITQFPKVILYSDYLKSQDTAQFFEWDAPVLIIDSIGLLSKLYSYADIAVVGGGFHSAGLHNILEAAVFGVPVFFGDQYQKNPEADELIAENGGRAMEDEFFAAQFILELLANEPLRKEMGDNAGRFISSQPNATEFVVKMMLS